MNGKKVKNLRKEYNKLTVEQSEKICKEHIRLSPRMFGKRMQLCNTNEHIVLTFRSFKRLKKQGKI